MKQHTPNDVTDILKRFDFQKVHDYMILTNWKWRDEIPSLEELRLTAARLLVETLNDPQEFMSMGTGGFRAYKFPWGMELVFAMERTGSF